MLTDAVGVNVNDGKADNGIIDDGREKGGGGGGGGGRPKIRDSDGPSIRDRISVTMAVRCTNCEDKVDTAGSDATGCCGDVVVTIASVRPTPDVLGVMVREGRDRVKAPDDTN